MYCDYCIGSVDFTVYMLKQNSRATYGILKSYSFGTINWAVIHILFASLLLLTRKFAHCPFDFPYVHTLPVKFSYFKMRIICIFKVQKLYYLQML